MKFKNIILITLLLLTILTIGAVSATDSNSDELTTNDDYNILGDTDDINDLSSSDYKGPVTDEDNTKNNDILSSTNSEKTINYTIRNTEVHLYSIDEEGYYVLHDSISGYSNSNIKFNIIVFPHLANNEGGTVTLKFNGGTYTADIFDGSASILAKIPSKAGSYKATLSYSGYTYDKYKYTYTPSSSTFTINVKSTNTETASATIVKAPTVTAYYKDNAYFKVTVTKNGKAVKNLKLKLKVYTGEKAKTYTVKTNSKGVASFKTNQLSIGTHKVVIQSGNKNYKISKTSKIIIKNKISYTTFKSPSGYKWQIKTSTWEKMKKQATSNYNYFKSVGSTYPGYSDMSVTVKVTKDGHTYTGTAYAVKNSNYMRCEIRGAITGVYISDKGDQIV